MIEDVKLGEWYDFDFCSKWSFYNGRIEDWDMTRDISKTLLTKHYY